MLFFLGGKERGNPTINDDLSVSNTPTLSVKFSSLGNVPSLSVKSWKEEGSTTPLPFQTLTKFQKYIYKQKQLHYTRERRGGMGWVETLPDQLHDESVPVY